LAYAAIGIALWSAATIPALLTAQPWLATVQPAALHLITVGWLTQMIFAVAHWLFPKHPRRPPRGREGLAAAAAVTLNAGVLLRLGAEPWQRLYADAPWLLALAGTLMWLGVLGWIVHLWPRVR